SLPGAPPGEYSAVGAAISPSPGNTGSVQPTTDTTLPSGVTLRTRGLFQAENHIAPSRPNCTSIVQYSMVSSRSCPSPLNPVFPGMPSQVQACPGTSHWESEPPHPAAARDPTSPKDPSTANIRLSFIIVPRV